jgi:hypothetical protein
MTMLQSLVDALTALAASAEYFTETAIVISLFAIALKDPEKERDAVYFIAALMTGFIALSMAKTHSVTSYGFLFLATYEFMKGMEIVYENKLSATGWSFVKKIYHKARGRE